MVVEPDIIIRLSISDYLRDCGYNVIEGVTSDDVLAMLRTSHKLDIIFSEIEINGEMNGFQLARWVREHHPHIGVILVAGAARAAEQAAELCNGLCDDGPLQKPYEPQAVLHRINLLLERTGRLRARGLIRREDSLRGLMRNVGA
jgi:DNA-binding NtrC family response regulator